MISFMRTPVAGYLVISLCGRIASALAMFVCVRSVSPEAFGGFGYMQASVAALVALTSFGVESSINTAVTNARKYAQPVGNIVVAGGASILSAAALIAAMLYVFRLWGYRPDVAATLVVAIGSLLQVWLGLVNGILVAIDRPRLAAATMSTPALGFLVCAAAFTEVETPVSMYSAFIASQTVACLLGSVVAAIGLHEAKAFHGTRLRDCVGAYQSLALFGLKSGIIGGAILIGQWILQSKMMSQFGPRENASFSLATQVYNIIIFAPYVAGPLLVRHLACLGADAAVASVARITSLFAAVSLGLVTFTWLLFPVLVDALLAPTYRAAIEPVSWAAVAAGLHFFKAPVSIYFQTRMRLLPEMIAAILGAAVVVVCAAMMTRVDANSASVVRAACHGVQLAVVMGFFLLGSVDRRTWVKRSSNG